MGERKKRYHARRLRDDLRPVAAVRVRVAAGLGGGHLGRFVVGLVVPGHSGQGRRHEGRIDSLTPEQERTVAVHGMQHDGWLRIDETSLLALTQREGSDSAGTRTQDKAIKSRLLYQLSYGIPNRPV